LEQVLQPAIELAENGFPLSERLAVILADAHKIHKYPTTVKIYLPNGRPPKAGEIFKNIDLAGTLNKLVEVELENKARGRHEALSHNSADYIHISAEAVKLAMADREKFLGDMDFITIPYGGLLSKDYARERRALIDLQKASLELRPGAPDKFGINAQSVGESV